MAQTVIERVETSINKNNAKELAIYDALKQIYDSTNGGNISISSLTSNSILVNTINEKASSGVVIEGVTLKDTYILLAGLGSASNLDIRFGDIINNDGFYLIGPHEIGVGFNEDVATIFNTNGIKTSSVIYLDILGTDGAGVTSIHSGDGKHFITTLNIIGTVFPLITGGVNQAVGALLYTFPDRSLIMKSFYMNVALTSSDGNTDNDTPKVALGTIEATGVVATLSGTAAFMNLITQQTAVDCNGTSTVKTALPTAGNTPIIYEEGTGLQEVWLNAADGWAVSGESAMNITGTVRIEWVLMS